MQRVIELISDYDLTIICTLWLVGGSRDQIFYEFVVFFQKLVDFINVIHRGVSPSETRLVRRLTLIETVTHSIFFTFGMR